MGKVTADFVSRLSLTRLWGCTQAIVDTGAGINTGISGIGSGFGSGVSALASQLDRLNDGFSKGLVFGGNPRIPLEIQPSLGDVFEGIKGGGLERGAESVYDHRDAVSPCAPPLFEIYLTGTFAGMGLRSFSLLEL